jgi:hypothetical protein
MPRFSRCRLRVVRASAHSARQAAGQHAACHMPGKANSMRRATSAMQHAIAGLGEGAAGGAGRSTQRARARQAAARRRERVKAAAGSAQPFPVALCSFPLTRPRLAFSHSACSHLAFSHLAAPTRPFPACLLQSTVADSTAQHGATQRRMLLQSMKHNRDLRKLKREFEEFRLQANHCTARRCTALHGTAQRRLRRSSLITASLHRRQHGFARQHATCKHAPSKHTEVHHDAPAA